MPFRHRPDRRAGAAALLGATLPLLGALPAHGADALPGRLTEDMFLAEVPVVLSATRLSQPLSESPAAITVIDRQMIEASGALTVPDVLRLVPGFQVGHVYGTQTTVTYHGLSDAYARRMQVLVDGRSVYSPFFGGVFWNDLPLALEDIDRIEVIRGPAGVTYGANSFAAVINILTRAPAQDTGGYARHLQGETGIRRTVARYAGGRDAFRYRLTAAHSGNDGLDSARFPDGQRTTLATFRGDWRMNPRDSLDIQLGASGGARDAGDTTDPLDPPHETQVSTHFQQLVWRRALGGQDELSVNFYHDYRRSAEGYVATVPGLGTATIDENLKTERYDLELQHTVRASAGLRLVWGAEARGDRVTGPGYFATPDTIASRLYRLFGNGEWRPLPDWIFNLGAMYENNQITGGDVSPRVAVNHHFLPDQTWRAAYSRAARTPSIAEEHFDWRPCLDGLPVCDQVYLATTPLDVERIESYELGYHGRFAAGAVSADVRVYREEIRDLLATPYDAAIPDSVGDGAASFRNDGHADLYGWEAQLDWRPLPVTRLVAAYGYARQDGRLLYRATPVEYLDTDLSTPVHTASLLAIQRLPHGFELSGAWYYVSNMLWLDQGGEDDQTGRRDNYDLRLAWRFRANGARGALSLVGQNLKGGYFDYQHDVIVPRRVYAGMELELP